MRLRLQLNMATKTAALFCGMLCGLAGSASFAQTQSAPTESASPSFSQRKTGLTADEFSTQSRRIIQRSPRRVRVYSRPLGPNSVRICNAHYEQEYRPSGTVIVPRMQCYWSG